MPNTLSVAALLNYSYNFRLFSATATSVGYIPTPINRPSLSVPAARSTNIAAAPLPVPSPNQPQSTSRKSSNGAAKRFGDVGTRFAIPPPQLVIPQLSSSHIGDDNRSDEPVATNDDVEPMDGLSAINALVLLTRQMNNDEEEAAMNVDHSATVVESSHTIDTSVSIDEPTLSSADTLRSLAEELSLLTQEMNGIDD